MLAPSQLKLFADFIQKETGIIYSEQNAFALQTRLEEITKAMNLKSPTELYDLACKGFTGSLRQMMLDSATNHETSFFRDMKIFQTIEKHILPELRKNSPHIGIFRVWCAASSFGQEPYSLCMVLSEIAAKDPTAPRAEVIATDIADKAIARSKEGKYSQLEVQRGLPAPYLVKYFTKTPDDYWQVKHELKIMVQFKKQNLLDSFASLGKFDFVLCRNVLIYQNEAKKKEILARIAELLSPKGFLVLGASESLIGLSDDFQQRFENGTIFFQKKT
jgi:chemotaxis protein methyltransferase CheR